MIEWCLAHPWMTLFLAFILLIVIEGAIVNICRTIAFYIERKYSKNGENNNA